jgi:hypothetical protein
MWLLGARSSLASEAMISSEARPDARVANNGEGIPTNDLVLLCLCKELNVHVIVRRTVFSSTMP